MVRDLMHDPEFLSIKAEWATPEDIQVAEDLLETLLAHKERCVGMAANMIGVCKRIIAIKYGDTYQIMINPEILSREDAYDAQEKCLSLLGGPRPCKRYKKLEVKWQTVDFKTHIDTFTDFTAQIIQHEVDHCEGILI